MNSSSSTTATIAAVAAGCSLILYGYLKRSDVQDKAPDELEDIEEEDCISADDVVAIFDKLFLQMQQVVMQLSQQVQQIQMAGQVIPEKQLRQLLKSEFERALQVSQTQVFEDNDVDADCLEEATWEFLDQPEEYPKVKRAIERFQKLYEGISGEDVVGWRPGDKREKALTGPKKELGPDEVVKAATIFFDTITQKTIEMSKSYKQQGKDLKDPQVQIEMSTDANDAAEEALQKLGITLSEFRSAIDKYSRVPAVGQTLGMLQLKQQQELMAVGVNMM